MESELSVKEVLTTEYVGVSESDTVRGAVRLMRTERAACVLVVRGSEAVGIMTEWDVLGLIAEGLDPDETTVGDVMSAPVLSIDPDRSLADAADLMARENIRNLVVRRGDDLLGVLTQRDVIAAAGSFRATTARSPPEDARVAGNAAESELAPNGGEEFPADEYTTQGVCEACGSLADSLWESNGQLLCSDCRSV